MTVQSDTGQHNGTAEGSALVWFRRDLRCEDHAALYYALRRYKKVHCLFVFDTQILDALPSRTDRRVEFIHASVLQLHDHLQALGASSGVADAGLIMRHGCAEDCVLQLAQNLHIHEVFANRDYEPEAIARDQRVACRLGALGIAFSDYKDQVLLEKDEVLNRQGQPYSVFTPYKRTWLQQLNDFQLRPYPVSRYAGHLAALPAGETAPLLSQLGFQPTNLSTLRLPVGSKGGQQLLADFLPRMAAYQEARDYPARKGVSYLSVHLRFGTVSIRQVAALAATQAAQGCAGAGTWLSELAWRDFYFMILWHHPQVVSRSFKPVYDTLDWDEAPDYWKAWCEARTGFPLIDAAMRQLLQTGYMHNRLRMVVASFLSKDLGIDWRKGERFFAGHLNDYDLAANNGGWQWAASTGCDAQPWFRIFNPITQSRRFDPEGRFIRRYLPELANVPDRYIHFPQDAPPAVLTASGLRLGLDYPLPIVDHKQAVARTLRRFSVLGANQE